jgi:hypothetical protein
MPTRMDPETINVDNLPGIWSPVQWELTEDERIQELGEQATASLLWAVDVPEAVIRLLLNETDIDRAFAPPDGYDLDIQGEWDNELVTFKFRRSFELLHVERERDSLYVEYKIESLGNWGIMIEDDQVTISHL